MTRSIAAFFLIGLLAGCGADGEPVQPTLNANVGLSSGGVHTGGAVGLHRGPVSLFLGF